MLLPQYRKRLGRGSVASTRAFDVPRPGHPCAIQISGKWQYTMLAAGPAMVPPQQD